MDDIDRRVVSIAFYFIYHSSASRISYDKPSGIDLSLAPLPTGRRGHSDRSMCLEKFWQSRLN